MRAGGEKQKAEGFFCPRWLSDFAENSLHIRSREGAQCLRAHVPEFVGAQSLSRPAAPAHNLRVIVYGAGKDISEGSAAGMRECAPKNPVRHRPPAQPR